MSKIICEGIPSRYLVYEVLNDFLKSYKEKDFKYTTKDTDLTFIVNFPSSEIGLAFLKFMNVRKTQNKEFYDMRVRMLMINATPKKEKKMNGKLSPIKLKLKTEGNKVTFNNIGKEMENKNLKTDSSPNAKLHNFNTVKLSFSGIDINKLKKIKLDKIKEKELKKSRSRDKSSKKGKRSKSSHRNGKQDSIKGSKSK